MDSPAPLISIVTVCLNSAKTIRDTIESVLNQTFQDYEYVIVDGVSTDGTLDIINEYLPKFNGRLRFVSEKDGGIYEAMNKGIRLTRGKLIVLLNSDDFYEPDALQTAADHYTGQELEIVYAGIRNLSHGKEMNCIFVHHNYLPWHMINHPTCFVTRQTYDTIGLYDTSYRICADYDFMLRCRQSKKVTFTPVHAIMVNFRQGGASSNFRTEMETARARHTYGFMSDRAFFWARFRYRRTLFYTKYIQGFWHWLSGRKKRKH